MARDAAFTQHSLSEDVTDLLNLPTTGEMVSKTLRLAADPEELVTLQGFGRIEFLYIRPDQNIQFRFFGGDTQVGLAANRPAIWNFPTALGGAVFQFNVQRSAGLDTYVQIHAVGT